MIAAIFIDTPRKCILLSPGQQNEDCGAYRGPKSRRQDRTQSSTRGEEHESTAWPVLTVATCYDIARFGGRRTSADDVSNPIRRYSSRCGNLCRRPLSRRRLHHQEERRSPERISDLAGAR